MRETKGRGGRFTVCVPDDAEGTVRLALEELAYGAMERLGPTVALLIKSANPLAEPFQKRARVEASRRRHARQFGKRTAA